MSYTIKLFSLVLLCSFLLSCNKTTNSENKDMVSSETSLPKEDEISEDTIISEHRGYEVQYKLFKKIAEAIALDKEDEYKSMISNFTDINALFPFQFRVEEEEMNYSLLGLACRYGQ